jgi:hypothetical protein
VTFGADEGPYRGAEHTEGRVGGQTHVEILDAARRALGDGDGHIIGLQVTPNPT